MASNVFGGVVVTYVSLCVDVSSYRPGILKLLEHIRPTWKEETIEFKVFEGGFTNCLVGVKSGEEDMLLVRVYGRNTEKFINRESEIKNLVYLNKHIGTPPVYAHFDNGLCYGYAEGRHLALDELYDKTMGRRIAKELAKMHAIPLPAEDTNKALLDTVYFNSWLDEIPAVLETEEKTARYVYPSVCMLVLVV